MVLGGCRSFLPLVTTFDIRKQFEIKSCPTAISISCWINQHIVTDIWNIRHDSFEQHTIIS